MQGKAIEELVKKYLTASGADKKRLLDEMLSAPGTERIIYSMAFGDEQRAALRTLADACRKKKCRDVLKPFVIRDADKLLGIKDDKARKTACAFIGECAPDECAEKLAKGLHAEKTRFVRPSIILALGNSAYPAKHLKGYVIEPGEDKHVREEAEALKKALSKGITAAPLTNVFLPEKCLLTSVNARALRLELRARGCAFTESDEMRGAFNVETSQIKDLRCYSDALYHIGNIGSYMETARALDGMGLKGRYYRIEAGAVSNEKRLGVIREISQGLAPYGFSDNPSAYSFEIRVLGDRMYAVFRDERFSYRKQAIPASINPVAAASIMRLCLSYMKRDASVLDPFCGSATMLIERGLIKKTGQLVGVDISAAAIKAACENRKASGLRIALIKSDILDYGGAKYDEVISNMPFGIRVSGHDSNLKLYRAFADKLESLLKDDGAAFLFTQEKKLLRETINAKRGFYIIEEENYETGGLYPTLFIIKRGAKK